MPFRQKAFILFSMSQDAANNKTQNVLTQILKSELPQNRLREGDVVEAKLMKKLGREAYFEIGRFTTGIVYGAEFMNAKEILRNLKVGDVLPAKVTNVDGEGGYAELSLAEAGK